MDRRIKLRHIECFVEISREGSLKTAAAKLFLTQPAISKTLKELEQVLGTTLMRRNRAGIELTQQGKVFLHYAQMSLANLEQGLDGIEQVGTSARERLTVGSLPTVAASLMPAVAAEFSLLAPKTVLRIIDGPHTYLTERLRLSELDLVIGRLREPDVMQGISFTQLYTEQVEFIVRAGHPIIDAPDLMRISDYQVLYPPASSAIRPFVERFLIAHGVGEIPNRIETVSAAFGRLYTRQSDAIWIISGGVVATEIADGDLVRLPFDTSLTKGPVGLMSRPDAPETRSGQIFRIAVQNVVDRQGMNT